MTDSAHDTAVTLAAEIIAAFVSNNAVRATELPEIIGSVHAALVGINAPKPEVVQAEAPKPAVSVKKSVTDEYIISLEDGRKFKSMKRYLAGLGMTPDDYRAKWGLARDYPMVAPGYAAKRSELARAAGLGRKPEAAAVVIEEPVAAPANDAVPEAVEEAPAKRRGRPPKKKAA